MPLAFQALHHGLAGTMFLGVNLTSTICWSSLSLHKYSFFQKCNSKLIPGVWWLLLWLNLDGNLQIAQILPRPFWKEIFRQTFINGCWHLSPMLESDGCQMISRPKWIDFIKAYNYMHSILRGQVIRERELCINQFHCCTPVAVAQMFFFVD